MLYEKDKWKFPHEFNPVNFLNDQGQFEKPEAFMPFSVGKITLFLFGIENLTATVNLCMFTVCILTYRHELCTITHFSPGPRTCLGEGLARMELFLILVSLLRRFQFIWPEDAGEPDFTPVFGVTQAPRPYKMIAKLRV